MRSLVCLGLLFAAVPAWAQQATPPPPTCEEQLNNEMFQAGLLKQQVAIAREQIRLALKERDAAQAALAAVKGPEKK